MYSDKKCIVTLDIPATRYFYYPHLEGEYFDKFRNVLGDYIVRSILDTKLRDIKIKGSGEVYLNKIKYSAIIDNTMLTNKLPTKILHDLRNGNNILSYIDDNIYHLLHCIDTLEIDGSTNIDYIKNLLDLDKAARDLSMNEWRVLLDYYKNIKYLSLDGQYILNI